MFVSKRLEQTITCSKSCHQNQEVYLIVGDMSKIYKERYLCQECMTRYRIVNSIMLCSRIEKTIQDLQNQFLERISIIVCKNIFQIIQLQQYLQNRGEKQTQKDNYEELFEKWQAELRKIAASNSFYSFRQTVENFCYFFQLLRDLKQGIQSFYQKKYENQIKAINECNFFYFQKLSQQFDCLVPIKNENKICQQPDSQFLVHVYVYQDYGENYEYYQQNEEEQELIYCSQQDTTLPILPLCIQGNDSKNNVEKIENEEALIALITRKIKQDSINEKTKIF